MLMIPPEDILQSLRRMRLLDDTCPMGEQLTGGVSSDIWRIDLPTAPVCIKRALARLRVAADWQAPVERNIFEARWMRIAGRAVPNAVPALLGQDEAAGMLAMAYLPPDHYPLWKSLLRDGFASAGFAASVAATLARIHAATAADPSLAQMFASDTIFRAIRLEPYLVAASHAHPDLKDRLDRLVTITATRRIALVHGDVSPKNILAGPDGPVFLDAECAWWGDPAFDLAFCLSHLLLKCLWVPTARRAFMGCFEAMTSAYLAAVDWESAAALQARAARLLPALLLARVDGKSPVEYITTPDAKDKVRRVARSLLLQPSDHLADILRAWEQETDR